MVKKGEKEQFFDSNAKEDRQRKGDLVYFITRACKKSGRIVSRVFCLTYIYHTQHIYSKWFFLSTR